MASEFARDDAALAEWCASTETRLAELAAQVRGLLQVQSQLRPRPTPPASASAAGGNAVVPRAQSKGNAETAENRARSRAVRRRVAQCELEDLREENAKLRRRIRELMVSQRDANLSCVMVLALALLAAAALFHMFLQRRAPVPASQSTIHEIV